MIIKMFYAKKVHGYLDFAIHFNEDMSFLTGGNGSGKTTALKLISALLTPNFQELLFIPFERASIEVVYKQEIIHIHAETFDNKVRLQISNCPEDLVLPRFTEDEEEFYTNKPGGKEEAITEISRKFADHPVIVNISKIPSPIFLGLERKREDPPKEAGNYYYERERVHRANAARIRARRLIRGSLGISLMETELLVQDAYRRMRRAEESYSTRLRDSILLSAFQYTEFDYEYPDIIKNAWLQKGSVLKRKQEIKEALSKIGITDSRLSSEVDTFFNRLTQLFERIQSQGDHFSIELLTNKAQIERIAKVVEVIDDHKSKIDRVFRPINEFLSTINSFFKDSNKKLTVDTVGQLVVDRPNGKGCTVEGLSSGERQILVIFAHAFFNRHSEHSNVFIIDEPELSLHLRWQEQFAKTILEISPQTQFIMATHSPEIVGENKHKAVKCR
ncbi:AAA family ATPase [Pseudomonas qingdaonensis]|uniref:AAA family ATPase n=1 Tax=Pseudomonas qingdaonensis TaxID=2056231 RepID=A0ABX8DPF3_9PSED|nr:AAA family ATPase [Pseudomonas qingdaonensis]QVL18176.1 AAA family ATPase [Pseudomonas qingdaonensis]